MASNSEKTHAKNNENLYIANSLVESVGAIYVPKNELLKAADLVIFEQTFAANNQAINAVLPAEQTAVAAQIAAFKLVPARVSMILKAAKALGLTAGFVANLQSGSNRLNGVRVGVSTPDNPETPEDESASNNSVSRRSYAGMLETLDLIDEQLKNNPDYAPNEVPLQSATITAWIAELRDLHNAALEAKIATRTARNTRNAHAYNPTSGILVRMNALKAYAATILDKNDPRLKQLKKLRFVDYSK